MRPRLILLTLITAVAVALPIVAPARSTAIAEGSAAVAPPLDVQRHGTSTGSISGSLGYPSAAVPPLLVYAIRVDTDAIQFGRIRTGFNQLEFTIEGLDPGVYIVLAYLESMPAFAGGYTEAVPCGLTVACADHTLIPITVVAGEAVTGVGIRDWYAPAGTFPPRPDEAT